jgi:hypothetical protein
MQCVQQILESPGAAFPHGYLRRVYEFSVCLTRDPPVDMDLPTRQAMIGAKRQLQISTRRARLYVTPHTRLAGIPINALTVRVTRFNGHCASGEPISEEITHVVPHVCIIEIVCEDGLADVGLEDTALSVRELEGDAARTWIAAEGLAIRSVFSNRLLRTDGATNGPQVYGFVALIGNDCAADSWRSNSSKGATEEGNDGESVEEHIELFKTL